MRSLFVFIFLLSVTAAFAQPVNDECLDAINISSTDNFCSGPMAFSNMEATADAVSAQAVAQCVNINFDNGIWFSFRPGAPAVLVEVNSGGATGSIGRPKAVLYSGSCTTGLTFEGCSPGNAATLEMTVSGLTVGQRYYLYIESDVAFEGSFQLCINEFVAPPSPESDCPTGVVLCDTKPFQVEAITTNGDDPNEMDGFPGACLDVELQSVWYKWTCKDPGTLNFTLTPNDYVPGLAADDLDFVVFELPNGINDCENKEIVKCMASGQSSGCDPATWLVCRGPTGLSDGSTDTEEFPGCNQCNGGDDDNFISSLVMEAGKSYALMVMNFSATGKGFEIDFSGTGTFQGPEPDFSEILGNFIECEKTVEYFDASLPGPDPIVAWEWNFGEGAIPQRETDIGPHETFYDSFGPKSVALTVESTRGCRVTTIVDIFVEPCCKDTSTLAVTFEKEDLICADMNTGNFELIGLRGSPEHQYSVNGGEFLPKINYKDLAPGDYFIEIVDTKGCMSDTTITITAPEPLVVDAGPALEIELGFQDTLDATITPAGTNVTYMWDPEEGLDCLGSDLVDCPDPIVVSPGTTTYTVTVTDDAGCTSTDEVTVRTIIIRPVYNPNVFTPDTNDDNNTFKLAFGRQVEIVQEFSIYDRWGSQIYQGSNIELDQDNQMISGWNGRFGTGTGSTGTREVGPGVYVWYAKVLFIDGVSQAFAGDVTIIK